MSADGDKGAVLQRDRETYAIAPHVPCGIITPELLRRIADVAEKYHAAAVKVTSAERIAIIGLRAEDLDAAWKDLGGERPGHMTGSRVRSVKACPGNQFCKRGRQDSLKLGMELDRLYHGRPMPGKLKIGVSGCGNQCAETCIKDIGLVGGAQGWTLMVGGMGGVTPRLSKPLSETEFADDRVMDLIQKVVRFYEMVARPGERLGHTLDRVGMRALREAVGVAG